MRIPILAATACLLSSAILAQANTDTRVLLKYAAFDPLTESPEVAAVLRAGDDVRLWIVQFAGTPTDSMRDVVRDAGGEVHGYLPENAHVARMSAHSAVRISQASQVRSVSYYEPGYRLEPFLLREVTDGSVMPKRRYNIVVVDKLNDKPALAASIRKLGGSVDHEQTGSLLFQVTLTGPQLLAAARLDEVLWIDRWTPPEDDMDNVRIQGGGNFVESVGGFRGQGVNGHVYEGIQAAHPDFTNTPINVLSCGDPQDHGHATSGIVFGNGTSNPAARGMAPDAQPFYTNYSCVDAGFSRWQVVQQLVNVHNVLFTTASWGGGLTPDYTSTSADSDDIVFDHDIPWTQSQSNAGTQWSRPQAWAKNLISIGGVAHGNNADRSDDSWQRGFGSRGPALDGRLKPELSAFYDSVHTSDRTGGEGYTNGDDYAGFGGTSAATPIVAGHNAIAIQMFTDGLFSPQRVPGGTRFQNRPHAATLKALQVANARQYVFNQSSTDNRRENVGFGFPDLRTMYDNRARMFVVDETDIVTQGGARTYNIAVLGSDSELRVAMCYADPAANPAASIARINNLNLRVIAPDATVYRGNNGLSDGNYSTPGGATNAIDTLECVFVRDPMPGTWTVEVSAPLIAQDGHVETGVVDADFGLCVSFGSEAGSIAQFGQGCVGTGTTPSYCAASNANGGTLSLTSPANEYGHEVYTDVPLQVSNFLVFMQSQGGNEVINAAIYGADPNGIGPASNPLGTTTMTVGSTPGFYAAVLPGPVSIPAGYFYIAVDNTPDTINISNLNTATGEIAPAYFRSTFGSGNWSVSSAIRRGSVRVNCVGGGLQPSAPRFDLSGTAAVGSTLAGDLSQARPNTIGTLATGFTPNFSIDLGIVGATGCVLSTNVTVGTPLTTGASGTADASTSIPLNPALAGLRLFQQVLLIDAPANSLGVVTSPAYEVYVGS